MSKTQAALEAEQLRKAEILSALKSLVNELTGIAPEDVDTHANFMEVGIDSLTLIQATQLVKEQYDVKLSVVQLLEQLTNLDALAAYIDHELPPDTARASAPPRAESAAQQPAPAAPPRPETSRPVAEPSAVRDAPTRHQAAPTPPQVAPPPQAQTYAPATPPAFSPAPPPAQYTGEGASASALDQLMSQQLQVMAQQLEMLRAAYRQDGGARPAQATAHEPAHVDDTPPSHVADAAAGASQPTSDAGANVTAQTVAVAQAEPSREEEEATPQGRDSLLKSQPTYVPYQPIEPGPKGGLTERQRHHLDALIERRNERMRESKRLTQESRPYLADSRTSFGFRLLWKELVYPVVSDHASGSRVWDVDGNEYVDISMGFGVHLFGHSPDFIDAALRNQIERKAVQLGPQVLLAGKVAKLFSEMTGLERVNFCNSGTEAVMGALRLARTVTRRSRVAIFAGAYHGWWDGTLAKVSRAKGERRSVPVGPGISEKAVEDIVMLDWESPESIDYLEAHAGELAAVMVEPVQSRRPDIQPAEFLRRIRRITERAGTPLIFDEMITGFRVHAGGAQAVFGVRADIATYGKVIGGGLPIGVIAGRPEYMDAFDGGMWDYGDDSYPEAEKTIFAGAFFKHPLTMSAAHAILVKLREEPRLLPELNERTERLAVALNRFFEGAELPVTVVRFGSLFRFMFAPELKFVDLFFYQMLEQGVYIWEGRNCFLSTAHTDEDLRLIARAVERSVEQMREGGFWPERPGGAPPNERGGAGVELRSPSGVEPARAARPGLQAPAAGSDKTPAVAREVKTAPAFSLYYFGSYESEFDEDKYELLIEGARFADRHGFEAVWIPERHFHAFGGFSPNPAVVAAALARETTRLRIRAGSVVLPLHNPIRVAEEWSVVDNLSRGRVGVSFASGWQPNDFVFAPESYAERHEHMYRGIELVQRLWAGEPIPAQSGDGKGISVRLAPMPMQKSLPVWLTGVSARTFVKAGELGANFLTNLQDQSIEELTEKIALYRDSLARHGHDPASRRVTLLLHTYVVGDADEARERARAPFYRYMRSSLGLMGNLVKNSKLKPVDFASMDERDLEYILAGGYKRYIETASLIGTPESCAPIVERLAGVGVDEVACMIDFGVPTPEVLASLRHLEELRAKFAAGAGERTPLSLASQPEPTLAGGASAPAAESHEPSIATPLPIQEPPAESSTQAATEEAAPRAQFEEDGARLIPLTDAQRQLWITAQIGPDASRAYNESVTFRLRGPFDPDAMRGSLLRLVERHDILRATFSPDGQYQRINPSMPVEVPLMDFSHMPEDQRESEAASWIAREVGEPFDLARGPLVRFNMLKLDDERHLLVLNNHHLVADGQSWSVLLAELRELYAAARRGAEAHLPAPRSFGEFVERQRPMQGDGGTSNPSEDYWVGLFSDSVPLLDLPTDRPRPPVQTYNGARLLIETDPALFDGVRRLCASQGTTVYMTLLAAYCALLHRLSGQEEIIVGVPAAGQLAVGRKDVVGYCINLMPILSDAGGDPSFAEYLASIKRRLMESLEHQHYSFGSLLKRLNIPWDASRSPLFTTIFNIDRAESAVKFVDLEMQAMPNQTNWTRYDLRMNVIESDKGLTFDCTYNTDLFDEETLYRWMRHFETLLASIASDPARPLWRMPILDESGRRRLLEEWSETGDGDARGLGAHELFEERAAATPDAVALVYGGRRMSYAELNRRADALAARLAEAGVGPEVFVGLCAERSADAVVGMLAVLKAGGAYVPLDPSYPRERLRFMLEDSGARFVLTQKIWAESLPDFGGEVLYLDGEEARAAKASGPRREGKGTPPSRAACVYYTSGSTGAPKGVVETHGGVANYLAFVVREYAVGPKDVVLQLAPLSFDASVRDIIGPLVAGARLVMLDEADAKDPLSLLDAAERYHITCMLSLVPSRLATLLEAAREDCRPDALRLMLLSGESLPVADCLRARECFGEGLEIVNQYGPTECTMTSTFHRLGPEDEGRGVALVGRPIAGVRLYVLDRRLEPAPVGTPGEVYIGGAGLARGYARRAGLTAERFVPNPYSAEPGARLYRTGDLGRFMPTGEVELLGRLDQQLKIGGVRIEPGEIEAALREHAGVARAAVVAREDAPGGKRLVAYFVPSSQGEEPSIEELRAHLGERLPEYMEPSAFVALPELPLTPHGKVDRKRLPAPGSSRSQESRPYAAPRTEVERRLAEIWCDVLMVERAGIDDDFFESGGNSLLATQLAARVRSTLHADIHLRELFERPTIAGLAAGLEGASHAEGAAQPPPVRPVPRDGELPLSFAQQRLWFMQQLDPNSRAYNVRGGIRLLGELDVPALERSLNEIIRRHEVLRTSFANVEGRPVQLIAPSLTLPLPVRDLTWAPEEEREPRAKEIAVREAERLFDLSQCPLLHVTLLRLGERDHVLTYVMHHIVADGWSMGILVEELSKLYTAFAAGAPSPLPELTIQYADFAHWQQQRLRGEVLERQLALWKKRLAGAPAALELPADRPRPPVQTYRGARQAMALPAELSAELRELSRREGVTLFMTLLAAFQVLLSRYTGQRDIVVGSDIANRNFAETEPLIGFFVNQIVLRTDLSDNPTFRELLSRVRATALEAYEHQDLPFEKLVEALQPERHLSRSPIFQAKFLLQNTPHDSSLSLPGLTLAPFNFEIEAATFDLLLSMVDTGGGLRGLFEYSTDLFDDETVRRFGEHFVGLLASLVADPLRRVADVEFISEAERGRVLAEWNETAADFPRGRCVHELFEAQAARTPDAVAVVHNDTQLTYAELNRRANQLAHHLRGLGVGAESLVGLCVERSHEMAVGLLGILKAGGAYLPLDPSYPLERLSFMLDDARVAVLLTQESLLEALPAHWSHVVSLDGDRELIAAESEENPAPAAGPDNLAYVIYTSGSTGMPKGVMLQHEGLCNMVAAQVKEFDVRAESRVLQFASFSFDASVSEVFMALLAGARLYFGDRESLEAGPRLHAFLRENAITTVTLPPSLLAVMKSEGLPALKALVAAGEQCSPETVERWSQGRRFFNAYGPTEFTVCATISELEGAGRIVIGRPIANSEVYVLDAQLRPVPVGVYGELHLGGVQVARGYLNRAGLTAEKFVPNPYSTRPGARLYKTGDLARWTNDGRVEYAGRIDTQFKVRGYRVEAGEVEAALDSHPEVRTSVVVAREDDSGEKQLVAYCVPETGEGAAADGGAGQPAAARIELWPSVAEFYIYDDLLYHAMTEDERRNRSYKVAINRHVRGKVVLDIGTGKDAILARFCVEAGAARVYAIELLKESYDKAKATVERLGLGDKIILINGNSMEVELPEKVDVCVSEIVGPIGGSEGAARIINDAWRFMKDGGVMIPSRSLTKMAAVTLPEDFLANPGFTKVSAQYVGKVFEQVGHKFDLRLCMKNFSGAAGVVSNQQPFEDLDFRRPVSPEYEHDVELVIERDTEVAGFVLWLNLYTAEDEVIDILKADYCWLPVYLPVFYPAVQAREGDRIRAKVKGVFCNNGLNLDYTVTGTLERQGREDVDFDYTTYHHKEVFRADEFHKRLFPGGEPNTLEGVEPQALARKLKAHLKGALPDYMIPSHVVVLDALPLTPSGKVDRKALPEPGRTEAAGGSSYAAPRDALESQLAWMWEELLGVRPVGVRDSFFELGGHSLLAVRLMARIKAQFGVDLPISALFGGETVEELAKVLSEQGTGWRSSPLVPIQPRGSKPPFFCVHALGGNVNNYYALARRLGVEQPFYGLQAPPLHEADEDDARIEVMAARYLEAMREVQPAGPYRLGGYSFGSFVAYEMARQLRERGHEVAFLGLLDTYSPVYLNRLPQTRDVAEMLVSLAWSTSREHGKRLLLNVEELRRLGFDEQLDFFLARMREEGLAPPEVDHELLARFLKGSAARQRAARDYAPEPYDGPLTLFNCEERDALWVQRIAAHGLDPDDRTLGWGELTSGPVEVLEVPGHHDVICQEPYVETLAARLGAALEAAGR
jgi:natural product biosynthesis luciferase-like monooxygenase protein/amino acid adenylation domain-containing protein